MSQQLASEGYEVRRGVLAPGELAALREEATRVAAVAGSACVRNLQERSSLLREWATSAKLLSLIPDGMRPVRMILFDKTPEENWPVAWHQDLSIAVAAKVEAEGYGPWSVKDGAVHVQPPLHLLEGMVTLRLHLDPTGADNGALLVIPGSHRRGRWDVAALTASDTASAVVCECEAGDALLMSPLILHASKRSAQPGHRRILHIEYARQKELHPALCWHVMM